MYFTGKNLFRDDFLISTELQDIIDDTFGNENDGHTSTNTDDDDVANDGGNSEFVANSKFIQLSSIQSDTDTNTSSDCFYQNKRNSLVFRETTV